MLLSLTSMFWALNAIAGRLAAGKIPPVTLAWTRWSGALILLLPFVWHHLRADWPRIRSHLGVLLLLSLTGIATFNTLAYIGLQYTEALNALLIQSMGPLTIGLASLLLLGERMTGGQVGGILLSLVGVLAIMARGDVSILLEIRPNVGDLCFVVAMAIYAVYAVLLRRSPQIHPLSLVAVTFALGNLMLTPAFVWEVASGACAELTPLTLGIFAYVVLFPSLIAYIFYNRGVRLVGANRSAPFLHLIPLFGSAFAILGLGEELRGFHLAGYALILSGIALAALRGRAPLPEADRP